MDHRASLVLVLLCALGSKATAAVCPICPGRDTSSAVTEVLEREDEVSLLQVSMAAPAPSRQRARPSAATNDLSSRASKEQTRAKLRRKIIQTRSALAMMELELAELDEQLQENDADAVPNQEAFGAYKAPAEAEAMSSPAAHTTHAARHANEVTHVDNADTLRESHQTIAAPAARTRWHWEPLSRAEGVSLVQLASKAVARSQSSSGDGDSSLFIGTVLYQNGVTQVFAEGEGCLNIPGVATIGGPSGLPDYLAYFANKIATEGSSMSISDQISKVSQAFSDLLPDAGNFHTVKIDLTMAGKQCMVQDRLNFSPQSKMCHIGLVWAGESAREFWITSYGGDGSEVRGRK